MADEMELLSVSAVSMRSSDNVSVGGDSVMNDGYDFEIVRFLNLYFSDNFSCFVLPAKNI